jgi:hypothetical protein
LFTSGTGVMLPHSYDLLEFHSAKACFAVKHSRYESRLSPSDRVGHAYFQAR